MEIFSEDFKKIFLLKFTSELIKHSLKGELLNLQKLIESEEEKIPVPKKEFVIQEKANKQPVREQPLKETPIKNQPEKIDAPFQKSEMTFEKVFSKPKIIPKPIKKSPVMSSLFIPEPKLPPHLEYLKPVPSAGIDIDLFKLNPLIKDPAVRVIEGNVDEKVIVRGTMGTKPTDTILSKEDIDRIINKFSEASKIPTTEGIYRVIVGNLILSAIISEVVGSRFIIRKMSYPTQISKQPSAIMPPVFMPMFSKK